MQKILFYNNTDLCTEIFYDFKAETVSIINHTEDLILRAFGINANPSWQDLEQFLRSRCFPEERVNKKHLLDLLEINCYDPWLILQKTKGKMEEDHQWLEFIGE